MQNSKKNYGIELPQMNNKVVNFSRKYIYIINIICFFISFIILGVSIFLLIDKSDLLTDIMLLKVARAACLLIIAASASLILISLYGIVAFRLSNIYLIIIYLLFILLILIAFFTGAIFALVNLVGYTDWIRQLMRESIQMRYGVAANNVSQAANSYETRLWDMVQVKWYCCGVEDNSWGVYRSSKWYDLQPGSKEYDRIMVPASCCFRNQYGTVVNLQKCQVSFIGPPFKSDGPKNEALYYTGCYNYGLQVLGKTSRGLIAMGFIMGLILISVLFAGFVILTDLRQQKKAALLGDKASSKMTYQPSLNPSFSNANTSFT